MRNLNIKWPEYRNIPTGGSINMIAYKGGARVRTFSAINISKFQFDQEFEGHGFVSRETVMCHPR